MSEDNHHIASLALSDIGKERKRNEDRYLVDAPLRLYIVADGMGGHVGGDFAAKTAVESVRKTIQKHYVDLQIDKSDLEESKQVEIAQLLSDSLRGACHTVFQTGQNDNSLKGMGTTLTALLLGPQRGYIAHVGDSRAYLYRKKHLSQLSEDHSLVNEQLKAGLITEKQARKSRFKNIITRSIGFEDDVDVDLIVIKHKPEDVFLLCSDGLTNMISDQAIEQVLKESSFQSAPQSLVDLANKNGGDDNITLVLVQIGP